jgi:hypothetical protein
MASRCNFNETHQVNCGNVSKNHRCLFANRLWKGGSCLKDRSAPILMSLADALENPGNLLTTNIARAASGSKAGARIARAEEPARAG